MTKPLDRAAIMCGDGDEHEFFVKDLVVLLPEIGGPCKRCRKPVIEGFLCEFCGGDNS